MMEIAYGPLVVSCLLESLVFGLLFALTFPMVATRWLGHPAFSLGRRVGVGLLAGGGFGIMHLVLACSADGFPPRIVQSAGLALVLAAAAGLAVVVATRPRAQSIAA
jgi:hypothetical protein